MANLSLQFKKKHIGFSASFMMNGSINQYFNIVTECRNKLAGGTYDLEDLITINISQEDLINLYSSLGYQAERVAAAENADMKATLLPQLATLAEAGDPTAIAVVEAITTIDSSAAVQRDGIVLKGLEWLTV